MNKLLSLLYCLLLCGSVSSDSPQVADSLLLVYRHTQIDSIKADILIEICREKWKYAEYAEAKKYADSSLILSEKSDYKKGIAGAYNQTGIVFWYLKDNTKALYYHKKSLSLFEETGDREGISEVYNRIGHDYADMPDYPMALLYFQKALDLDRQSGNISGIARNIDLIGFVYMRLSDYPKALSNYFNALEITRSIQDKRGVSAVSHDIAVIYAIQGKLNSALFFAKQGLDLALQVGEKHLIQEAYEGLENIYRKMNRFHDAYQTRLKFDEIETELNNADHAGKIHQMQLINDFEKKQVGDSIQFAKAEEINELKLQKQKIFTYGSLLGISITILLLFLVYRNYKKQRIANRKLREAQQTLIQSEKLAAFGEMASRLAHEIQNPMNFVNNFSEISTELLKEIQEEKNDHIRNQSIDMLMRNLDKIHEHGTRAAVIIKLLEEHSSRGTMDVFLENKEDNNT